MEYITELGTAEFVTVLDLSIQETFFFAIYHLLASLQIPALIHTFFETFNLLLYSPAGGKNLRKKAYTQFCAILQTHIPGTTLFKIFLAQKRSYFFYKCRNKLSLSSSMADNSGKQPTVRTGTKLRCFVLIRNNYKLTL